MTKTVRVLGIDAEYDFTCEDGALYVKNSNEEAIRVSNMTSNLKRGVSGHVFDEIHLTIDEHHYNDIAHQNFWTNDEGEYPPLYTIIKEVHVKEKIWYPRFEGISPDGLSYYEMALNYVKALDARGRNPLCIWPEHCIIGTKGCTLHPSIEQSVKEWSVHTGKYPNYVFKGQNPYTENYSAFVADVPRSDDPNTLFNESLYERLKPADQILIYGWAGSHCGLWTVKDLLDRDNSLAKKCVLLEDAFAPVVVEEAPEQTAMFAGWRDDFLQEFKDRGGKITTTDKYVAI